MFLRVRSTQQTSFMTICQLNISMPIQNYEFSFTQGYGPQNQLPQQENQYEEFLRLTNQVRRPIVELDEQHTWLHLLYVRQTQFIAQKLHRYFRQDNHRKLKQLLILVGPITIITLYLSFIWIFMWSIFSIDRLIGIKIILAFYFHTFVYFFCVRIYYLFEKRVSLYHFDLYFDAVKVIRRAQELIKVYFINPLVRFAKKCGQAIKKVFISIYKFMERSAIKAMDITQKYAVIFFQNLCTLRQHKSSGKQGTQLWKFLNSFSDLLKPSFLF